MGDPEFPDEVRDPFRAANRYTVPLSTLIGGAHIELAQQVELQRVSPPPDSGHVSGAVVGAGGDGDGD